MPWTFEDWQQQLAAAFLAGGDGPIVLFVNESELARIRPGVEDAARDLANALRPYLRLEDAHSVLGPVSDRYKDWANGPRSDPPPVLPLIAMTVLAATQMRSDPTARSTNYYLRLAQAMLPEGPDAAVEKLRNDLGQGGAFKDASEMWRGLHHWICEHAGTIGMSTIRAHPHRQRIGYALSQALIRQSDQISLTRFFHALRFHPDQPPPAPALARAFRVWTSDARNSVSEPLAHALDDDETHALVGSVLEAHAIAWDGIVLSKDGKRLLTVRLGLDLERWKARWLFAIPDDAVPTITISGLQPHVKISLALPISGSYYDVSDEIDVDPQLVTSGLRMTGDTYGAEFPSSPIVFLLPDSQTGAWSSVLGLVPFEEHLVAVASGYEGEFRQALQEAAVDGWRNISQRSAVLLRGYALYEKVRFSDPVALERVLSRLPILRRIGVAPVAVPQPRFVRGLPIARGLASRHYLTGGAPDLLLPCRPDRPEVTVTLNGVSQVLRATGFPLELRRWADESREHIIEIDGQVLTFTTLDDDPTPTAPMGTGTLGWNRSGKMCGDDQPAIAGASLDGSFDEPFALARRGKDESWLLHDGGRVEVLLEPAPPRFLESTDVDIPVSRFEIDAPTSARWLAQKRGTLWQLTELRGLSPRVVEADFDVIDSWRRSSRDINGGKLWELQLRIAGDPR